MCAGRREARTSNTKAKTTSTSTSMVAVTHNVTKLREQIDSSSFINNDHKYSETKKACLIQAGMSAAVVQPPCLMSYSNAIATKKEGKPPWHCRASLLTKRELERGRERSGRTVLALLCLSLANWSIFAVPGNRQYCSAGVFSVDLDRDLPAEEIAGVEWCTDAFVSLLEELKILFFLYNGQDCVEKIVIAPPKTNLIGNRDGACLYHLLSSTPIELSFLSLKIVFFLTFRLAASSEGKFREGQHQQLFNWSVPSEQCSRWTAQHVEYSNRVEFFSEFSLWRSRKAKR